MSKPKYIFRQGLKLKVTRQESVWLTVLCPFCKREFSADGILQHIYAQAKIEPYEHMMGIKKGLKHALFYKKNTDLKKVNYYIREWK